MTELRQITALTALLLLVCCSNGPNSEYAEFGNRVNTSGFGHKYAQPDDATEFVIGPGDSINIQLSNNPALSGTQQIRPEGDITMPFVGNIKVAGLTPSQIRDKIEILMSPYIREVTAQVIPVSIVSKNIYIIAKDLNGALQFQSLAMAGDMTLLDMFAQIGGVPVLADDCHVKVIRGDPLHPKVLNINVRDMVVNGFTAANIQMKPDDMVYLPPTFWARAAMAVREVTSPVRELSNSLNGVLGAVSIAQGNPRRRGRR